ncbi:MAG: hypothetical protein J7K84_00015 [Deltaproteobacteria bacterium]|nr:hypothetical protein [Deltaproteobacteria bacterium]
MKIYENEDVIASQVLEGLEINLVDLFGHLCCRDGSQTTPATTNNPDT